MGDYLLYACVIALIYVLIDQRRKRRAIEKLQRDVLYIQDHIVSEENRKQDEVARKAKVRGPFSLLR